MTMIMTIIRGLQIQGKTKCDDNYDHVYGPIKHDDNYNIMIRFFQL
jgi:hypothetical protein